MKSGAGPTSVLDASALTAFVENEPGADRVNAAMRHGALISSINWAEVLARLVRKSRDPIEAAAMALPGEAVGLQLVPFDDEHARESARLIWKTQGLGLSLADRAALALGQLRGIRVLTTDRAWRSLRLPIKIEVIR